MQKHLHVVGIGGIGISALARYYHYLWYSISGSDQSDSTLIFTLRAEGMDIHIWHDRSNLSENTDLVIYSEAIVTKPDIPLSEQIMANPELARAKELWIRCLSYPEALAEIVNIKKCIAIAGSHGKSTTSAMTAVEFMGTHLGASAIVGTQVPQLGNTNFHAEASEYFIIEACEYKRAFLRYRPYITAITNIDLDHLDYYHGIDDYISAFQKLVDSTGQYVIIFDEDIHCAKLNIPEEKKVVIREGVIYFQKKDEHGISHAQSVPLPPLLLQVPWEHILKDAYLAFAIGHVVGIDTDTLVSRLQSYTGAWRRSEIVRTTYQGNMLMSDYGHHPNEIIPTLKALHEKYPDKKLYVVFQPHQYSRTRELLPEFARAFQCVDTLVIPDIYFSRDKKSDVEWMTVERLIEAIRPYQPHVIDGKWLENTAKLIQKYDKKNPNSSIILLLGAGNVDDLRKVI